LSYHGLGREDDARRKFLEYLDLHHNKWSVDLAGLYAQLGDKLEALQTLAQAQETLSPDIQRIRVAWELDPIRNEPQFKAIEERLNLPP
jgi:hypothetical protein